jgi:hypothetical protein
MGNRMYTMLIVILCIAASSFSGPAWAAKNCEAVCSPQVDKCMRDHPIIPGTNNHRICVQVETDCLRKCQKSR